MTSTLTSRRISEACMADAISQVKVAVDRYNATPVGHKSLSRFVTMSVNEPSYIGGKPTDVILRRYRSEEEFKLDEEPQVVHSIDFYHDLPGESIVLHRTTNYLPEYVGYYNAMYRCPEFIKLVGEKCFKDGKILDEYLPHTAVLNIGNYYGDIPLHTQLLEQVSQSLALEESFKSCSYRAKYHALPITGGLETIGRLIDNLLYTGRAERVYNTWNSNSSCGGETGPNNIHMLRDYMIKHDMFKSFAHVYKGDGNWELMVRD